MPNGWLRKIEKNIFDTANFLGLIGSAFAAVMVLLLVTEVILRMFGGGMLGTYEMVEFFMIPYIFLSMGRIQAKRGNIQMGMLYDILPKSVRNVLDVMNDLCSMVLILIMTYAAFSYTIFIYKVKELSALLYWPKSIFLGIETFGLALLSIVLIVHLLGSMIKLIPNKTC